MNIASYCTLFGLGLILAEPLQATSIQILNAQLLEIDLSRFGAVRLSTALPEEARLFLNGVEVQHSAVDTQKRIIKFEVPNQEDQWLEIRHGNHVLHTNLSTTSQ